jgi:hypothetical protein
MFITVFSTALHLSLPWTRIIQSTAPYFISLRSILFLYTRLRLGLPSGLFSSRFPSKFLHAFLFTTIYYISCPSYPVWLNILIIFSEEYELWSSSLCSLLQSLVTSSLFDPNILLSNMFSNTFTLCISLNVRDSVSHSFRITVKIIVLYISIFTFLESGTPA